MEASRSQHRSVLSEVAFDDLVRTQRIPLERYARSLGASREDAEEIAATALLRAYVSAPAARHPNEWRAWLSTVARNLWIDARRRRELRLVTGDGLIEATPAQSAPLEQVAETAQEARQICAAMALLPPAQRAAIYLREFRGLSYEEIGAELGMTTSVVTATLQRARATIKRRHGGITHALSALAVTPLALLRRVAHAGRLAGAPGAAAKIAVPVILVAGAGGAGVLAATEHATEPPVPAVAAAPVTAPASPASMRALHGGAPVVTFPLVARHTRPPAALAPARATVRPAAAGGSPKPTPAPASADAVAGTPPTAATPAGAAPGTVTRDSRAGGAARRRKNTRPAQGSRSASARRASPARSRAATAAERPGPPAGAAGGSANGVAHASAAPGTAKAAAGGAPNPAAPATPASAGPAAPTGNGGAQAATATDAPASAPPAPAAASAPAGSPHADTPGPANGAP